MTIFYYYNNENHRPDWPANVHNIIKATPEPGKCILFAHMGDLKANQEAMRIPPTDVMKQFITQLRDGRFSEIIVFSGAVALTGADINLAHELLYKGTDNSKSTDHIYPLPFKIDLAREFLGFIDAVSKSDTLTARKYFEEGREETETAFCILLTIHLLRRLDVANVDMKQPGILNELTNKCINMDVTDTYWLPVVTGDGILDERLRLFLMNYLPFFNCSLNWISQLNNINETNRTRLNKWLFDRLHLDGTPMTDKQGVRSADGIIREGS